MASSKSSTKASTTQQGAITRFLSYEEYLDSQIRTVDEFYLGDKELARDLVYLGYRGDGRDVLSREEFDEMKKMSRNTNTDTNEDGKQLAHAGVNLSGCPFLLQLAHREELVRNGKLSTIVFVRDRNQKGQEVSGYIDFGFRMQTEDFKPYFERKKRFLPRPSDLSYYNWKTHKSTSNSNANFQVISTHDAGILFKNKMDRKIINVDPEDDTGENSTRTEIKTDDYLQVVIYDHMTRRKN